MPGTDPAAAAAVVVGELPDLVHLPELPARGPAADLVGRGAALLAGLPVDLQPGGWRLTARPSRDGRRARDLLARDLDALDAAAPAAPAVKVQCAGPWTLAAALQLPRGEAALTDRAAVADLAESLAEGLREHLADVGRRFPAATVVLQVDEPGLPAVQRGRLPTSSGAGRLRTPDRPELEARLRTVLAVSPRPVVHCCAERPPVELARAAGAGAVSVDAGVLGPADDDELGEALEAGVLLLLGLVPGVESDLGDLAARAAPARALWRRLGLPPEELAERVVVTPACGLSGGSLAYAAEALAACSRIATRLREAPE